MGKKVKVGKQRKDRFYHLAKETGFRSRAAFKLIQLNRKFEFLQKSKVCIDLCAAPGGWMQVARQNMPVSSIVIGVDLFAIKPIPGCITLKEDITTDKCRVSIQREIKTWKVDVILHDGAPNVGRNWLHDSYQQACLTLSALKLATSFLKPGGWFVTKVFRSKDYQKLVYVFSQLFKKVQATKPQASRLESAEIFVVCQSYLAPKKVDVKLLDPKYVFEELDIEPNRKFSVLYPDKQKRAKAVGYPDHVNVLHTSIGVVDFIKAPNVLTALENLIEIRMDNDIIKSHPETTPEIIECCKDIKVLGRREIRLLLKWHKKLSSELCAKIAKIEPLKPATDAVNVDPELALIEKEELELDGIEKELKDLKHDEIKALKRKKKKKLLERKKLNEKLNLSMVHKDDVGPDYDTEDMFSLKQIRNLGELQKVSDQSLDTLVHDENDDDDVKKARYKFYSANSGELDDSGLFYKDSDDELQFESEGEGQEDDKESGESEGIDNVLGDDLDHENPLVTDLEDTVTRKVHKAELWFSRDAFNDLIDDKDEDVDFDRKKRLLERDGGEIIGEEGSKKKVRFTIENDDDGDDDNDDDDEEEEGSEYDFEALKQPAVPLESNENKPKLPKHVLDAESLALGTMMVNSKKVKRDVIDDGWNKFMFNDEGLPSWFVDDEKKHMVREIPVPKELVEEIKSRNKRIDAKPIKKAMEAKARKKKRASIRFEKAKKKVEALLENSEVPKADKVKQINKLYKRAKTDPKKEINYVVTRKHLSVSKRLPKPSGAKGRYKRVDPRMKKDSRKTKLNEKNNKSSKKSKHKRK